MPLCKVRLRTIISTKRCERTPIRTANNGIIPDRARSSTTCNAKVSELDATILVGQNVRALDVSVDDTLVVEIDESLENLRNVHSDEGLRELAKLLAYIVEGPVLTEPALGKVACSEDWGQYAL